MELYLKVRLARSEGMSQRELARHFNISRDSVRKMLVKASDRLRKPSRKPNADRRGNYPIPEYHDQPICC